MPLRDKEGGIKRRQFFAVLGGAATCAVTAKAQNGMPLIGFLHSAFAEANTNNVAAFRQGLGEAGLIEGQNVIIEFRWAEGRYDQGPAIAADFVRRHVAVIASGGGEPTAVAAQAATATIPIVFVIGNDPVRAGLVARQRDRSKHI